MRFKSIFIALVYSILIHAQTELINKQNGIHLSSGMFIPHDKALEKLGPTPLYQLMFEHAIAYNKTKEHNNYQQGYQFGIIYTDNLASGYFIHASYHLNPLIFSHTNHALYLKNQLGLTYASHPYDYLTNPINKSYSLYINVLLNIGFEYQYKLNEKYILKPSLSLQHISNGAVQDPNYGYNMILLGLGLSKASEQKHTINTDKNVSNTQHLFECIFGSSNKSVPLEEWKRFWVHTLSLRYTHQYNLLHAFTLQADAVYDGASAHIMQRDQRDLSALRLGIAFGHAYIFRKFDFGQQLGYYYFSQIPYSGLVYQQYYLMYHLIPKISLGLNVQADLNKAQFSALQCAVKF